MSPARTPGPATPSTGTLHGEVAFVAAGPGDEGLLTLRAVQRLREADVVVLDEGRREALLRAYCREGVAVVDAGFGDDGQPLPGAARAALLVGAATGALDVAALSTPAAPAAAADGEADPFPAAPVPLALPEGAGTAARPLRVVRLLDGDPALAPCLLQEVAALREAGVGVELVPGVSPAFAVPTYAGVPLAPEGVAGVHVVRPRGADVDWSRHVADDTTVVVLGLPDDVVLAAEGLLGAGRGGATPVAVTAEGTTVGQRTHVWALADVPEQLPKTDLDRPVTAVVGAVVDLRGTGSWFETKPLFGWRVLVPRTKEQAGSMVSRLEEFGATADVVPTISVEPPRTPQQIEKAVKGLVTGRYEWIGFTSVNAVRAIREKFQEFGLDARAFAGLKVAAVGGVTAAALREWGIEPDLVPTGEQSAQGLLEEWPPFDDVLDPINRVFLPRADIATDTLVAGLQAGGWEVDDVTAYRTVRAAPPPAHVREAIKTGQFDAVVFTSSSTVRNLVGIAGKPHTTTVVACIGPATAKTATEHGLRVDVLAQEPNVDSLVAALAEYGASLRAAAVEAGDAPVRPSRRKGGSRRSSK
ncbi:MAG: uroporphyrinogen-III synthase [Kineosporiaceae bacterium]